MPSPLQKGRIGIDTSTPATTLAGRAHVHQAKIRHGRDDTSIIASNGAHRPRGWHRNRALVDECFAGTQPCILGWHPAHHRCVLAFFPHDAHALAPRSDVAITAKGPSVAHLLMAHHVGHLVHRMEALEHLLYFPNPDHQGQSKRGQVVAQLRQAFPHERPLAARGVG